MMTHGSGSGEVKEGEATVSSHLASLSSRLKSAHALVKQLQKSSGIYSECVGTGSFVERTREVERCVGELCQNIEDILHDKNNNNNNNNNNDSNKGNRIYKDSKNSRNLTSNSDDGSNNSSRDRKSSKSNDINCKNSNNNDNSIVEGYVCAELEGEELKIDVFDLIIENGKLFSSGRGCPGDFKKSLRSASVVNERDAESVVTSRNCFGRIRTKLKTIR